jgi:hypothetical protein
MRRVLNGLTQATLQGLSAEPAHSWTRLRQEFYVAVVVEADQLSAIAMIELDLVGQNAWWIVTHRLVDPDTGAESESVVSKGWLGQTRPH